MELFIVFKNRDSKNIVDIPSAHARLNNVRAVREIEGCRIPLNRFRTHIWGERTNRFFFGIPVARIMLLTGHKTESAFFKYIRIQKQENATILSGHPFFRLPLEPKKT